MSNLPDPVPHREAHQAAELSDALKQELDRRIADLQQRPEQLEDVDVVIRRLREKRLSES